MKEKISLLLVLCIGLICNACVKEDEAVPDLIEGLENEILDPDQVAFCDNQPIIELSADEVLMSNGLTLAEYLQVMDPEFYNEWSLKSTLGASNSGSAMTVDKLKGKVSYIALQLMKRDRYSYKTEPDKYGADGPKRPQQHGLAYSYGSRDHTKREAPKYGDCMDKEIYGLDCSGFIYRCFFHSGVTDPALKWRAEEQRQVERLKNAILKAYPELTDLKIEDKGALPLALVKPGDIIYWLREDNTARHIGWIFKTAEGEIKVAQSNGEGENPATCDQNYGPGRGPRVFSLKGAIMPRPYSLGDKYSIVRISSEAPEPEFINCYVKIRVYEYWRKTEGGIERDFELNNLRRYSYDYYTGSFEGNTFTGELSKTIDNLSFSGSIIAILNDTHDKILYLKWNETMLNSSTNCKSTESLILKNIPYANDPMTGASTFEVKGKTSCDHISSLTAESNCPDSESFLVSNKCTSDSEISIIFKTW